MRKLIVFVACSLVLQSSGQKDLISLELSEEDSDDAIYDYYNYKYANRPSTSVKSCSEEDSDEIIYGYEYDNGTSTLGGAPWWCGIFTSDVVCGPNCCNAGECCDGPNVCATGEVCERLKCQHGGGQVCGDTCCKGDNSICCVTANGLNQCVPDAESCQQSKCFDIGGNPCGEQCCTGNSTCCPGTDTCVSSFEDCIALECIRYKGQACGKSCCEGGTICCEDKCLMTIDDCFAEQCLKVKGIACGKKCCQEDSANPHCCSTAFGCTKDVEECKQKECPNWCFGANDCCPNAIWGCCPANSGLICAMNPLHCRRDFTDLRYPKRYRNKNYVED